MQTPEERRAKKKACDKAYRETHKDKKAAYREVHKDEIAAYNAAYGEAHKAEGAAYREANKDRFAARQKAYREAHKAEILARQKAYRETHKDKKAAYRVAAWQKANPDKCRDIAARRRALKRGATVDPVSRAVVFDRDAGRCHLCGKKVNPKHWHLDHIVPLSQGGEHSYRNVAVSCPFCNMSKGAKIRGQLRLF